MRRERLGPALLAAPLTVLLGIVGCGGPAGSQATSTRTPASTAQAKAPQPAGKSPSAISRMICTQKAATEIAQVMGAQAAVARPTWADTWKVHSPFVSST